MESNSESKKTDQSNLDNSDNPNKSNSTFLFK